MKGAEFSKMVVAYGERGKSVAQAFGPQKKMLTLENVYFQRGLHGNVRCH